ncbi:MAG: polynucleotide adenylyltransferase PcnB [Planctomycetes bacterium]|nr:polynucleotide adenylyltransferase PcnB [Planctomycetota bacterium]
MASKKPDSKTGSAGTPHYEAVIPRAQHPISRKEIDRDAMRVMKRLNQNGHEAYLVGGAVRDLYLGKAPKDYDIATDATPSRLRKLFRNCRIIGRRFKIGHIYFEAGKVIEVATFRQSAADAASSSNGIVRSESGIILRDNAYGTPQEDARRRDLTINGLFYDLKTFAVLDYVDGVKDIKARIVRMISEPDLSFSEDPVRMLRALRHSARTGFRIEDETMDSIIRNHADILQANSSRLLEEILKDLRSGAAAPFFKAIFGAHLLGDLLPVLSDQLSHSGSAHPFWRRIETLDSRVIAGSEFSSSISLSLLLYTTLFNEEEMWNATRKLSPLALKQIRGNFQKSTAALQVSRRDTERILQIARNLSTFNHLLRNDRAPGKKLNKNYSRDVLDCLEIEVESTGENLEITKRWSDIVTENERKRSAKEREKGEAEEPAGSEPSRRKRRRRRRRRGRGGKSGRNNG